MTLVRVKPAVKRYRTFNDDFDRLFSHLFAGETNGKKAASKPRPAVNIIEKEGNYRLELAAPGMKKENFNIDLDKDVLTISANKQTEKAEDKVEYKRREFGQYQFERSFRLPDYIDVDAIEARYEQGILKLVLPRKKEADPKRIEIA